MNAISRTALLLMLFFCSAEVAGIEWDGELFLTGGYRSDSFTNAIKDIDDAGITTFSSMEKGESLSLYQIGFKGRAALCGRFSVRGEANFGAIGESGKYIEKRSIPPEEGTGLLSKIKKGHSYDYRVAGEYLYPINSSLRVGPTVGYGYLFESVTMRDAKESGEPLPILDNLTYSMRWQGPFIGLELAASLGCFDLLFGYQYNFCDWRALWLLDGPDIPQEAFSDRRKGSDAHANIVFVDIDYRFCRCWKASLGFKYQNYRTEWGTLVPKNGTFESLGFGELEKEYIPYSKLVTYSLQIGIGREF